jgi:hypothetical protein
MTTQDTDDASATPDPSARIRHDGAALRGATYAALAAIAAAVIGLGSTFIAGYFESERSQDEFLRDQRQQLYGGFLGAAYDVNTQTRTAEALTLDTERVLALEAAYDNLRRLKDQVQLLASPATTDAATLLRYQLRDNLETLAFRPYCDSGAPDPQVVACRKKWTESERTDPKKNYFKLFVSKARGDLQVG